jgi:hypothetical protein
MREIVQLEKSEYEKLVRSTQANEERIERLAQEMYEEKGTLGIKLEVDSRTDTWTDKITLRASSYVKDWDNVTFPISMEDKRLIVNTVNSIAKRMIWKRFGHLAEDHVAFAKKAKELERYKGKLLTLTVAGWLCAILLTLITVTK